MRALHAVAACLAISLAAPQLASAKQSEEFRHSYDQVWRTAIRMIRVDQGFPIRDRDEEIGFFLFEYRDKDDKYPGSVELIRTKDGDDDLIRVVMQIPAMPSYIEQMLLDKLERKLDDDYGEPPRRVKKKPDPEPAPSEDEKPGDDAPSKP